MSSSNLYVGCMTGTSVDGLDLALIEVDDSGAITIVAAATRPLPELLRRDLLALSQPEDDDIDLLGSCDQGLGLFTATAVNAFIEGLGYASTSIRAIGSHGQTLRHLPPANGQRGFSMQIGDPSTIAANTNIDVIADFRQADMAQQGHGAPLAPAFHQFALQSAGNFGVLNLGGIANITIFDNGNITAWDTGPASTLMDAWILRHQQRSYDNEGQWATSGQLQTDLLAKLLAHPYFSDTPPKSTGFEVFNLAWLDATIASCQPDISTTDVQATLLELSATSIAESIADHALTEVLVCGGGVYNKALMARLQALMPATKVLSTQVKGVDPQAVEAMAFAWLAWRHKQGLAGNVCSVTGAHQAAILGGLFPRQK